MKVGIAGLGRMGAGIAANIIRAGHDVTVWNRSQDALQPVVDLGARPAKTIEEVVQGDLLISMLADDKAFKDVGLDGPLFRDAPKSLIHLNTATISLDFARSLVKTHVDMGIAYVAATVFGRADIAAAGTLTVVVGGPKAAVDAADPVLKALGRNVFFVGEAPENANLVKLAGNLMLAAVIESFGEALALVRKARIDPATFYQVMTADLFAAPAFKNYGRIIVEQEYDPPGFLLRLGLKDQNIILDAGTELNVPLPLASLARDRLLTAMAKGYGDKDWVAFAEMIADDAGLPIQAAPARDLHGTGNMTG